MQRNLALERVAKALESDREKIEKANESDLEASRDNIPRPLYQRLGFSGKKLDYAIKGVRSLIGLEDPLGRTINALEVAKGLELYRVSCPIGVIGCVFESRPDALIQIACLCLKSGNSVILKGGSEAQNTNRALFEAISKASSQDGIPQGWIQLLESRQEVSKLLGCDDYVDLIIPRGSNEFVRHIKDNTRIPVLGHSAGVCHVYIDSACDMEKAIRIAFDAKCQYPAVCNAMETLLVHKDIAGSFLPRVFEMYERAGVRAKGDDIAASIVKGMDLAKDEDWFAEYNDLILNVKVVGSLRQACDWINEHGSKHTDSIVTQDPAAARYFLDTVDSSSVMWNASTRFSDGFRYGLGAEVGISTNKIHARGPVGTEGLTIYKWIMVGEGHIVADFEGGGYTHNRLDKKWE